MTRTDTERYIEGTIKMLEEKEEEERKAELLEPKDEEKIAQTDRSGVEFTLWLDDYQKQRPMYWTTPEGFIRVLDP